MQIDHVALYVRDLEAARNFFLRYFGASANGGYHNPKTGLRTFFLTFEDGARLELMNRPEMADHDPLAVQTGYCHLAFHTGSREAVNALTERLRADGCPVTGEPRVTGDGYYESCVQGPEGCLLELTV